MAVANPALAGCLNCPHPQAAHSAIDEHRCRLSGCPCTGYEGETTDEPATPPARGQTVMFTIPEGYGFSISFWPHEALPAEEPTDA